MFGVTLPVWHACPSVLVLVQLLSLTCKTPCLLGCLPSIPIEVGAHLPLSSSVDREQAAVTLWSFGFNWQNRYYYKDLIITPL